MKRLVLLIVLCVSIQVAAAEKSVPQARTEKFLSLVEQNKIDAAYKELFIGSSIPGEKPAAVTMLKEQTGKLRIYGKILGYEMVSKEEFGNSLIRFVYILKSEKLMTVWQFYYYKPKKDWFLVNVNFNDKYNLLSAVK